MTRQSLSPGIRSRARSPFLIAMAAFKLLGEAKIHASDAGADGHARAFSTLKLSRITYARSPSRRGSNERLMQPIGPRRACVQRFACHSFAGCVQTSLYRGAFIRFVYFLRRPLNCIAGICARAHE